MAKKKYVLLGTGSRCSMYLDALGKEFKEYGEILALCDSNHVRMNYWRDYMKETYGIGHIQTYQR